VRARATGELNPQFYNYHETPHTARGLTDGEMLMMMIPQFYNYHETPLCVG